MLTGYPRPQMERESWVNLNGTWNFAFDDAKEGEGAKWFESFPAKAKEIQVPYTYETKMSGIGEEKFHPVVWYQKTVEIASCKNRMLLHFEGVDYEARVWVNGYFVGSHTGAYARFDFDITSYITEGKNKIVVCAIDSNSCVQPRGKQRWKEENFGCWYVQTTGIWKTVWLEEVSDSFIESVKITPDYDRAMVRYEVKLAKKEAEALKLSCKITLDERVVSTAELEANTEYVEFEMPVANPDEPWQMIPWSPANPKLYHVTFELAGESGSDLVKSYFGMRKIEIKGDKILLNNLPLYQRLILDQGYWEESHLTPPDEEAIVKDIDLIAAAGYNGLRKHQKVEDERFLYWCDVKGMLVWCEMPSQYTYNDDVVTAYTKEWMEIVRQNYNHPCVITWTAFNESWGVERIFTNVNQQKFTEGIYHLTKAYDPMRPVIVNDGWEHTVSDVLTLHDYEERGEIFAARYAEKAPIVEGEIPFNRDRYAFAKGYEYKGQPVLISEYGGIAFSAESGWGYGTQVKNEEEFIKRFANITGAIKKLDYCVGFCYTQVTDVQQEINGLYTIKREPKVSIEKIKQINTEE